MKMSSHLPDELFGHRCEPVEGDVPEAVVERREEDGAR
jgi:hypothetical protein